MLLLWLFCFSPGSTGNGVQTSRKQSLLTSNNPTTLCIDSQFFSSVCCCDILYIYIHMVQLCDIWTIACYLFTLLVVAKWTCRKQRSRWFVSFYFYETNFLYRHTIWVYGSLRPIWLFITFLYSLIYCYEPEIQNIVYKNITQKILNITAFSKIIFIQSPTLWLLIHWAIHLLSRYPGAHFITKNLAININTVKSNPVHKCSSVSA